MQKNTFEEGLTSKLSSGKAWNPNGKRGSCFHAVKTVSLLIGLNNRAVAAVVPKASTKGFSSPSDELVSVSDLQRCSQNLKIATTDSNNMMTANEFVKFINLESNNYFGNVTSFQELPLELIQIFNFLACNCAALTCCENHKNNSASEPSVNLTKLSNSTSFCTETVSTLDLLMPTFSPTPSPYSQQSIPIANKPSESIAPNSMFVPTKNGVSSSPQPTVFSRLVNVEISLIGCNIYNFTTQDIINEKNNMILTIETALKNLSISVVMDERQRRNLGALPAIAANRHLNAASYINSTVLTVKNAECTYNSSKETITFPAPVCSSCLLLIAAVILKLDGREDNDFKSKLYNAIKSKGLEYPGFLPLPATMAPTPRTVVGKSTKLGAAALVGISFAAFAAGFLTTVGLYQSWKRHRRSQDNIDVVLSTQRKVSFSETVDSQDVKDDRSPAHRTRESGVEDYQRTGGVDPEVNSFDANTINAVDFGKPNVDDADADNQLTLPAATAINQANRNLQSILEEESTSLTNSSSRINEDAYSILHRIISDEAVVSQADIVDGNAADQPITIFSGPVISRNESSSDEEPFIDIGTTDISTSWNSRSSNFAHKRPILSEVNSLVQQTASDDISSTDEGGFIDIGIMDISTSWNSRTSSIGYNRQATPTEHTSSALGAFTKSSTSLNMQTSNSDFNHPDVRAEVQALVQRVVPDEMGNLDEMMDQFKGREEELLETLRSMHQRDIAQRERNARNNSAKIEAKREVQLRRRSSKSSNPLTVDTSKESLLISSDRIDRAHDNLENTMLGGPWKAVGAVGALISESPRPFERKTSGHSSDSSTKRKKKKAVEEEQDWEAAGTAAASYYDNRSTNQFPETNFYQYPSDMVIDTKTEFAREHLEKAIEVGNWEAVGAVAALMSDASLSSEQESSGYSLESTSYKLKKAIEERDWEAVGMAAALMNDDSDVSRNTHELHQLSEYESSGYASASSSRSVTTSSSIDPDRASMLDNMIEIGDWTGVVLAVQESPEVKVIKHVKKENSKNWRVRRLLGGKSSSDEDNELEVSQNVVGNISLEEQRALSQGKSQMAFTSQNIQVVKVTEGASEAADWAIERSLSALRKSDQASTSDDLELPNET